MPLTRRDFVLSPVALAAESHPVPRNVQLGTTQVRLINLGSRKGLTYFHPHEDEYSSAIVTRALIRERGGSLLELRSHGTSLISFKLGSSLYTFDPDRIFTDVGIVKSLIRHSRDSPAAASTIKPLRAAVLSILKRSGQPIVTVHNNGPNGLNIASYRPGGPLAAEVKRINTNPKLHPHDFFYVPSDKLFARLSHLGFNVVQQSDTPSDDGSLAVYCRQHALPYVLVEASDDHASEQKRMLESLSTVWG